MPGSQSINVSGRKRFISRSTKVIMQKRGKNNRKDLLTQNTHSKFHVPFDIQMGQEGNFSESHVKDSYLHNHKMKYIFPQKGIKKKRNACVLLALLSRMLQMMEKIVGKIIRLKILSGNKANIIRVFLSTIIHQIYLLIFNNMQAAVLKKTL